MGTASGMRKVLSNCPGICPMVLPPSGLLRVPAHRQLQGLPALEPQGPSSPQAPAHWAVVRVWGPTTLVWCHLFVQGPGIPVSGQDLEGCQPGPGNRAEKPGGAGGAAPGPAPLGEAAWWVQGRAL